MVLYFLRLSFSIIVGSQLIIFNATTMIIIVTIKEKMPKDFLYISSHLSYLSYNEIIYYHNHNEHKRKFNPFPSCSIYLSLFKPYNPAFYVYVVAVFLKGVLYTGKSLELTDFTTIRILKNQIESAILPRMIVGVSMLFGILVAGLVFVTSTSLLGWLAGHAIDAIKEAKAAPTKAIVKK